MRKEKKDRFDDEISDSNSIEDGSSLGIKSEFSETSDNHAIEIE